jgi:preprotein translocase subunit SecF
MLQLLVGTNFAFMKYRRLAYVLSIVAILATTAWLVVRGGPRYGVDFAGGTLLQIRTTPVLAADQMRNALEASGLTGVELQQMTGGNRDEYLLRLRIEDSQGDPFARIQQSIESAVSGSRVELRRTEVVGPKVGNELREKAVWAILGSLGGILLYVGFRYEFKFALGAVVALFHDVFVTFGILCFANREISLTVIAALLTIAGFSINDKVVVFDRIRERSKASRKESHTRTMDIAVNETLSRTIITNITVLLSALALFVWGGDVLRDFSLATLVGILLGTYSSVYLASALALDIWIGLDRRKGLAAE